MVSPIFAQEKYNEVAAAMAKPKGWKGRKITGPKGTRFTWQKDTEPTDEDFRAMEEADLEVYASKAKTPVKPPSGVFGSLVGNMQGAMQEAIQQEGLRTGNPNYDPSQDSYTNYGSIATPEQRAYEQKVAVGTQESERSRKRKFNESVDRLAQGISKAVAVSHGSMPKAYSDLVSGLTGTLTAGLISSPMQLAFEISTIKSPEFSPDEKARAAANSVLQLLTAALPGGASAMAPIVKAIAKGGKPAVSAIRTVLSKSKGVSPEDLDAIAAEAANPGFADALTNALKNPPKRRPGETNPSQPVTNPKAVPDPDIESTASELGKLPKKAPGGAERWVSAVTKSGGGYKSTKVALVDSNNVVQAVVSWSNHGKNAGAIDNLWVRPERRRQGLATDALKKARELFPELKHSAERTNDATAWATSTGDEIPKRRKVLSAEDADKSGRETVNILESQLRGESTYIKPDISEFPKQASPAVSEQGSAASSLGSKQAPGADTDVSAGASSQSAATSGGKREVWEMTKEERVASAAETSRNQAIADAESKIAHIKSLSSRQYGEKWIKSELNKATKALKAAQASTVDDFTQGDDLWQTLIDAKNKSADIPNERLLEFSEKPVGNAPPMRQQMVDTLTENGYRLDGDTWTKAPPAKLVDEAPKPGKQSVDTEPQVKTSPVKKRNPSDTGNPPKTPDSPSRGPETASVEGGGIALANKSTNVIKRLLGEPEYEGVKRESIESWAKAANEKGYDKPDTAHKIAEDVIAGTKKHLDDEETIGLASALDDLESQFDDLSKKYMATAEKGGDMNLATQLEEVTRKMSDIVKAGNVSGAEWGRSGIARQAIMKADGSFQGILARRQKTAQRNLTPDEVKLAREQAAEIEVLRKRIADYESKAAETQAQQVVTKFRRESTSQTKARIKAEREAIHKEIDDILKSSVSGVGANKILYDAARLSGAVGKLAVNYAKEGIVVLDDLVKQVLDDLAARGITGATRHDVIDAMTDARKRKASESAEKTVSDSQNLFAQARKERSERLSEISQREREVRAKFQKGEREKYELELKIEKDALAKEHKLAQEAERWYWADVKRQQSAHTSNMKKEVFRRWRASVGAQRIGVLNRLDKLNDRLDFHRKNGAILGQKSNLKAADDPILNDLRIQEASAQRQVRLEDARIKLTQEAEAKTTLEKVMASPGHVGNAMRDLITYADNSWMGIQGALAAGMNPKAWLKGFGASFKSAFSKGEKFASDMDLLRLDPDFDKVMATGVELPALHPDALNEFFATGMIDRALIIKNIKGGSRQAFEAGATVTRFKMVKSWINSMERHGRPLTPEGLKVLGEAANTLTGRASGKAGNAIRNWPAVGQTLFAPSWWVSQFQTLTGKPVLDALKYGARSKDWRAAKLMAKEYTVLATEAVALMWGVKYAMDRARAAGLTDYNLETDINDPRFGKVWVKRGDTVIAVDFLPPQLSGPIKTIVQVFGGKRKKDGTLDKSAFGRSQVIGNTFQGKYGPGIGTGLRVKDSMNATDDPNDATGKPKYPFGKNLDPRTGEGQKNLALQTVTPISIQQGIGSTFSDKLSPAEKAILGILSVLGRGANVYKED